MTARQFFPLSDRQPGEIIRVDRALDIPSDLRERAVDPALENELSRANVGADPSDATIEALANEVGQ